MRLGIRSLCLCVVIVLPSAAWAADRAPAIGPETPAEKLRKALAQVRDLEIREQPLDAAVNSLREQTGINFVIDRLAVVPFPVFGQGGGLVNNPVNLNSYDHLRVRGQFHNLTVRAAVAKMLRDHGLTHVLVGDTVLITTPERAIERQLGQTVSVNLEGAGLSGELKRLARETGANLVLDPRSAKEGQTALTLRLDEVPLETAVELLADEAGLRAVRMNNVLYVTSEERAKKLRKARPTPQTASGGGWQVWPDGTGGFRMLPPAGAVPGAALIGFGGIGGIAGLAGGGLMGAVGGAAGGPAAPVPLTPPLPKKDKQAAPEKPKPDTPPAKPAVKPLEKDKPAPKGKPESLAEKLDRRIDFEGFNDPKLVLAEALDHLKKTHDLPYKINVEAFRFENVMEPGKQEIATPKPLPAQKQVRLGAILHSVLARMPVPSGATFVIRSDYVEITTNTFAKNKLGIGDKPKVKEPPKK